MACIPPAGSEQGNLVKTVFGIALIAALVAANPALAECNERTGPNVVTDSPASASAQPKTGRMADSAQRIGPNIVGEAVAGVEKPRSGSNPRATPPSAEPRPCVRCVAI